MFCIHLNWRQTGPAAPKHSFNHHSHFAPSSHPFDVHNIFISCQSLSAVPYYFPFRIPCGTRAGYRRYLGTSGCQSHRASSYVRLLVTKPNVLVIKDKITMHRTMFDPALTSEARLLCGITFKLRCSKRIKCPGDSIHGENLYGRGSSWK